VVVTAADEDTAIAVEVVAGQRHDARRLKPVVRATARRVGEIAQVVGGKGFDGQPQRDAVRAVGAEPVIPARKNRVDPEPLDAAAYRERSRVERLFAKAKEFRRIATRYDKRKRMFLGWLHLVFGFIRLRAKTKPEQAKKTNVNRA
jgi:transposase